MARSYTKWITVDTEIDLEDFSDDELLEELENRGVRSATDPDEVTALIEAMRMALCHGNDSRALAIAREVAEKVTGRLAVRSQPLRRVA